MHPQRSPNFAFLEHHDPALVALSTGAENLFAVDTAACIAKLRLFGERLAQRAAAKLGLYVESRETQLELLTRLGDAGAMTSLQKSLFHELRKAGNAASHDNVGSATDALTQLRIAHQLAIWFQRAFGNDRRFDPGPYVPPAEPKDASTALHDELERLRSEADRRASELEVTRAAVEAARADAERESKERLSAEDRAAKAAEEAQLWELLAGEQEANVQRSSEEKTRRHATLEVEHARLVQELKALQSSAKAEPATELRRRIERAAEASDAIEIDEATTRKLIDRQLREASWEANSESLRYERGARPEKGKSRAIAEWPTMLDGKRGFADYVLFVGLRVVGVVEAKRKHRDVSSVIDQAKRYSRGYQVLGDDVLEAGAPWRDFNVPFLFATNGRPYLRQLETKSGIWFLDARRPTNHARALEAWFTPDGLVDLLKQDVAKAEVALATEPMPSIVDRAYQHAAIRAIEKAIADGRDSILVAMATGTGKTRTCLALCYRLVQHKRMKRVLFLVDRSALGQQTLDALRDLRIANLQTFADIFEVKGLEDAEPDASTRFHVATVQGMVHRLFGDSDAIVPIDRYDCVVVDECHRGYVLDRELSDRDFAFRSEDDYISKYRRVLDHFAAVKIGLTATPALHTQEIFGAPVFTYTYREAVIDGYLVDHEPPTRIVTKLASDGIHYEAHEEVQVLDRSTSEVRSEMLPDHVDFDVDDFHRTVISKDFNRVVLEQLAKDIDPASDEKTLIFCVNDEHAELVVDLLKKAFEARYGEVDDDAVLKITGATDRPLDAIRRFKNERNPNVAVTVELLTTGIDVPRIANLVFLRRVASRILYEQMIGRATRLCPEIGKERFRIFDAVDLYARLSTVSAMKPVVTDPAVPFASLAEEIAAAKTDADALPAMEQFLAKFQRKKRSLQGANGELFGAAAGMDASEFASLLRHGSREKVAEFFRAHDQLAHLLDRASGAGPSAYRTLISEHADELREVTHGYGADGRARPSDYLDDFRRYVADHMNRIPALLVVVQRPRDLTRKELRELRLALDSAGFDERKLRTAWADEKSEDIAATIIGYIRGLALGSPLVPYAQRVDRAVASLVRTRKFTDPQRKWLDRIAMQLKVEIVVDRASLDTGAFAEGGGFVRIDKIFEGQLLAVVGELAEGIWKDAG